MVRVRYASAAQVELDGVEAGRAWSFLRDPATAGVLLPEIVQASVVSGEGVGERQRYVVRDGGREVVSLAEVTALVPGHVLELTLLGRPYAAGRRLELAPTGSGTLLVVRSWVCGGWSALGLGRRLQEDDDAYVRRAGQVLPVLLPERTAAAVGR